jgi:hypothetical protein
MWGRGSVRVRVRVRRASAMIPKMTLSARLVHTQCQALQRIVSLAMNRNAMNIVSS